MKRILAAALAAALIPAAAQAQSLSGVYAGAQAGYHDFDGDTFNGAIFGGYVGVNAPVGEQFVVGVEGNANLGTNDIDAEYGVSAHAGVRAGTGLVFARIGWQQVELENGLEGDDVLYGIGGQFPINERSSFRVVVDTIDFDTTRVTGGVSFNF